MLQGQTGTTVDVTYRREGQTRTVTLTRAQVVIPSTDSELVGGSCGVHQLHHLRRRHRGPF